jgi:hypothetical protein
MTTAHEVIEHQAKSAMVPMHFPAPTGFAPGLAHAAMPAAKATGMGLPDKLDLAGLGILAAPAAYTVATGDKPSDSTVAGSELAGLGTLAGATMMKGPH